MACFSQSFGVRLRPQRQSLPFVSASLSSSSPSSCCLRLRRLQLGLKQSRRRIGGQCCLKVRACAPNEPPRDTNPTNGTLPRNRREVLLEYVQNVQPQFMELFIKRAPPQVVEAMRQTVTNMIGTLPPQFFAITVTTVAENLAQLMFSVLMTGYMFKNAQYRLELQQSLEQVSIPETQEKQDMPDYAPGTQKKVTGEVIRWNNVSGTDTMDAVKYIELLEAEVEELKRQVARRPANGKNEILEYLKSLEPQNLQLLLHCMAHAGTNKQCR